MTTFTDFSSTTLASAFYDCSHQELHLDFRDGSRYLYDFGGDKPFEERLRVPDVQDMFGIASTRPRTWTESERDLVQALAQKADSSGLQALPKLVSNSSSIPKIKMPDLNSFDLKSAMEQVKGTAMSMGVDVV